MFARKRIVEFADTDMAGIVHFAEFFRYVEAAEHAYLRELGIGVFLNFDEHRLTFPRVSASCDYVSPARFGEELTIEVAVDHLGKSSIRYAFTIRRDETLIARASVTAVLCRVRDDHGLEPFPFPEALREKLLRGPE